MKDAYIIDRKDSNVKDEHMIEILNKLISDIINVQSSRLREKEKDVCNASSFPFMPMRHTQVIEAFFVLKRRLPDIKEWSGHRRRYSWNQTFLDAGCGIGNVLATARAVDLCSKWHGIEYFEKTYERAKMWLGIDGKAGRSSRIKIFKDDILTFKKYKDYDVIYFYCPFHDYKSQVRFEEYMQDEMKVGAILIPFNNQGRCLYEDKRFKRINGEAWIKIKNGERQISEIPNFRRPWMSRAN